MSARLPSTMRKYVVKQLSTKFRDAVELVTSPLPTCGPKDVLVKNRFVGINASDINYTSGRYDPGVQPPFDVGFEGVGEVVATGAQCSRIPVGQPVVYMKFGSFADYTIVPEKIAMPVPSVRPEYVPLYLSGLTAAISLDQLGDLKKGENVLITAAAGGTGQFAVQMAKLAGCHVIGTCSSNDKVQLLKKLGCDRPINYTEENLKNVLKSEYPNGVDVIYESIGGETFDTCVNALGVKGRLIVIGFVTGYDSAMGFKQFKTRALPAILLRNSSSIRGFFAPHYQNLFPEYLQRLIKMEAEGKIFVALDNGIHSDKGPFKALESIPDAVEYLFSKKSVGKILAEIPDTPQSNL